MAERVVHWHTETPENHLATRFVETALRALFDRQDGDVTVIHSWGDPEQEVAVRQFPLGRSGTAASWRALTEEAQPELQVVVRPAGVSGGSLALGRGTAYPQQPLASWTWDGLRPETDPELPNERCYPALGIARPVSERLEAPQVLLLLDPTTLTELAQGLELAARLQQEVPELQVRPGWDAAGWEVLLTEAVPVASSFVPNCELGNAARVVFFGSRMAWAPLVLRAMAEGRHVLVSEEAEYRPLVRSHDVRTWSRAPDPAGAKELTAHLRASLWDPAAAADSCRRASAWARRWTPAREGAKLLKLLQGARDLVPAVSSPPLPAVAAQARPATGRTRWVVRREVGIGDIVFSLTVAAALKTRDPEARVRFHTAPAHAEWVSWFPQVDEVTHGPFQPRWGERVADFETVFPGRPRCDRSLALGAEIGVAPEAWSPAPCIPQAEKERTAECLGPPRGLRIALALASRTHARPRTLPPEVAHRIAERLRNYGEVLWLDADAPTCAAPGEVRDLRGRLSAAEAWAALALCDLVVSVDSGLLYAGVTLRKPVVGIFSHIAALERLWLAPAFLAIQPHLPCAPCGEGPAALHCLDLRPNAKPAPTLPPCLGLVGPEVVEAAVVEVLRQRAAGALQGRIWNVGPDGNRTEWDVNALPAPWRPPLLVPERDGVHTSPKPPL